MRNGTKSPEARARSLHIDSWQGLSGLPEAQSLAKMRQGDAGPQLERYAIGGSMPGREDGWLGGFLQSIRLRLAGPEKIEYPYLQSWLIHACVTRRADALAGIPARLWRDRSDDATRIEAGPLYDLLSKPNPWMSSRRLWEFVQNYRLHDGECFLVLFDERWEPIATPGQLPRYMIPVRGGLMDHQVGSDGLITAWRYQGQAATTFLPHQVVQIRLINPYTPLRGLGTVQVALRLADQQYQMDRYDDALLRNYGMPSLTLASANPLTPDQAKQAEERVQAKIGGPEGAGKPLVLGNGLQPVQVGFTPVDMQFLEKRMAIQDATMALFGVTKPLLAITDDVNRANAREAVAVFLEHVVMPDARKIEDDFQELFIANLNGPEREYAFGFDTGSVDAFKEDRSTTVERVRQWYDMGVTVSKAAELEGLDVDLEESDLRPPPPPRPGLEFAAGKAQNLSADQRNERNRAEALAFDRALTPHDESIAKAVERVQRDYVLASLKALREHTGEVAESYAFAEDVEAIAEMLALILPDILGFADKLQGPLKAQYARILDQEAARMAAALKKAAPTLTSGSTAAASHLQVRAIKVAEGTMSTLAQYTRESLARILLDEGATTQTLTRSIRENLKALQAEGQLVIKDHLPVRALRIARTESGGIANYARVREMELDGITHHEWLDSGDEHVRHQHAAVHGEVVRIGERFSNGLRWPLDDSADDPGQVVNCRCLTVAAFPEEAGVPALVEV